MVTRLLSNSLELKRPCSLIQTCFPMGIIFDILPRVDCRLAQSIVMGKDRQAANRIMYHTTTGLRCESSEPVDTHSARIQMEGRCPLLP